MKAPPFPGVAVRMLRAAERNKPIPFVLRLEYVICNLLDLTNQ